MIGAIIFGVIYINFKNVGKNIKTIWINNILGKHCANHEDTKSHVQNGNDCCGAMFPISSM